MSRMPFQSSNDKQEAYTDLDLLLPNWANAKRLSLDNVISVKANIVPSRTEWKPTLHRPSRTQDWQTFFAELPERGEEASPRTDGLHCNKLGEVIYRLRKCTVEPVLGIIKEIWASASSLARSVALPENGVWCVWRSISTLGIPCTDQGLILARPKPARKWRVALETCSLTLFCVFNGLFRPVGNSDEKITLSPTSC